MRSVACITALSLCGCALATTRGPEDPTGRTRPTCTPTTGAAKLDLGAGTVTGLSGIVSGLFIADDNETMGYSILAGGIAALAAFYVSASVGIVRYKRCKDAIGEYNFRARDPIPLDDDAAPTQPVTDDATGN
jgi:hypothetical protein